MTKDYESVFDNMTNEDLEKFFTECGIEFEKVEPGKGGFVIKDDFDKDCICRKEDDWDWYKLCIYKTNNKYYLQYPIEVYSEPLDVKIEIQYCPYCGRKLE